MTDRWNTRTPQMRLNAISPYYTMFPADFPGRLLERGRAWEWVLDPFCGRGTSLFAARTLGMPSVGVDVNPVAVATAKAKLVSTSVSAVVELARRLAGDAANVELPDSEFFRLAYQPSTLTQLVAVREGLLAADDSDDVTMLRAIMLGILHGPLRKGAPTYLSNQMPRTYASKPASAVRFWRRTGLEAPRVDVVDAVRRRAEWVLADLTPPTAGCVHLGDARRVLPGLDERFSWVITSPPYLGMRTYLPDQWLRAWFLGGSEHVAYSSPGAIETVNLEAFSDALTDVLRAAADRCHSGAHLIVRFGALPSVPCAPAAILKGCLDRADSGWEFQEARPAGLPRRGSRQAVQMRSPGSAVEEIDVTATLR